MSAVSCITVEAIDDLIHKKCTLLMLLTDLRMKCASSVEGHGTIPCAACCSPIQ